MHLKTAIVGIHHNAGAEVKLSKTAEGATIDLVREPDNPYDKYAVACVIDGVKCGYVPRAQARNLAKDIDAGRKVTATINDYRKLAVEIADDEPQQETGT